MQCYYTGPESIIIQSKIRYFSVTNIFGPPLFVRRTLMFYSIVGNSCDFRAGGGQPNLSLSEKMANRARGNGAKITKV